MYLEQKLENLEIMHTALKNMLQESFAKKGASNKNRKKIIEFAKLFVDTYATEEMLFTESNNKIKVELVKNGITVSASAKCNASDVYNLYIGKAIALGRLLNMDVSIFIEAPQPKKYAVGQLVTFPKLDGWHGKVIYQVDSVKETQGNLTIVVDEIGEEDYTGQKANASLRSVGSSSRLVIYDDTCAQY